MAFRTARCCSLVYAKRRKYRYFFLIGVVVGPLPALVASVKAIVSFYRKYAFVSGVYTRAVGASFLKVSTLISVLFSFLLNTQTFFVVLM